MFDPCERCSALAACTHFKERIQIKPCSSHVMARSLDAEQVCAPPRLPLSQSIEAGVTQTNTLTPPRFFLSNLRSDHPQCHCATQDVDATSQTP
jgi:hypothetical protein